jgi:hypothetical protein
MGDDRDHDRGDDADGEPKTVPSPMKSQRSEDMVDIWIWAAKFTTNMS